jgi:pimeloyl-ACP methyl ester carboxylesterase
MQLNHVRRGAGPPLLLVHGTGSFLHLWDPVLDRLAASREVIAIDLPGFGGSPSLAAGTRSTAPELARAVAAFMDVIGLETAHVAGNSLGGWVALELARRGRARSVTGLSTAGFWTEAEGRWCRGNILAASAMIAALRPGLPVINRSAVARRALNGVFLARADRMPAEALTAAQLNLADSPGLLPTVREALTERFYGGDEIRVPVTVAWGERDRLLFPRQADRAVEEIPGARKVVLAGCGHAPTWDDPERVARVLLEGSAER